MELLWLLIYCRRGTGHVCVVEGAELLVLSNYCRRGNTHVCEFVNVELVVAWI